VFVSVDKTADDVITGATVFGCFVFNDIVGIAMFGELVCSSVGSNDLFVVVEVGEDEAIPDIVGNGVFKNIGGSVNIGLGVVVTGLIVFDCMTTDENIVGSSLVGTFVAPSVEGIGTFDVAKVGPTDTVPAMVDKNEGGVDIGKDVVGEDVVGENVINEEGAVVTGSTGFGCTAFDDKLVGLSVVGTLV